MTTTVEGMAMKPDSQDLRLRIVHASVRREGAMRQVATRLAVSLSFVCDLITRHRAPGHVAPEDLRLREEAESPQAMARA
jgi:transposase